MSRGGDTRFCKGESGNPKGRPRQRRPHVSAFDIIFDKVLTVTQGGKERQLTVDEALQLQTYQAALKGGKMAIRAVLKMIEKREVALVKHNPPRLGLPKITMEHDADNANEAMRVLGIGDYDDSWAGSTPEKCRFRLNTWAAQAAISRPGRRRLEEKHIEDIKRVTFDSESLNWPNGRRS